MAGGRRDKYETHVKPKLAIIAAWARNGLIDKQIAENLGVGRSNFIKYKNTHEELRDALKSGKEEADLNVENALYKKAVDGDNVAMIFWLKNRNPIRWRDKQELEHSGDLNIVVKDPFADQGNDDDDS